MSEKITLDFVEKEDWQYHPDRVPIGNTIILVTTTSGVSVPCAMNACAALLSHTVDRLDMATITDIGQTIIERAQDHNREVHGRHKHCSECGQQIPEE